MVISSSMDIPLLLLTLLLTQPTVSEYANGNTSNLHDNSEDCNCYVLNSGADSKTPSYFQHYRFFDFRNLASEPDQYVTAPPLVKASQDSGSESYVNTELFDTEAWQTDWSIQSWSKPASDDFPIRAVNSPANIYISQNADPEDAYTWLTLRTSRTDDFQSVAEMENLQKNVLYGSFRFRGRVVGDPGAVAGFFTFFDKRNETDVEILTRDAKDTVRYTNQPALDEEENEVPGASQAVGDLPAWDEWQTHRVDWLNGDSFWWVNGGMVARSTYSVPTTPSYLVLNMWGDGGEWSGEMQVGGKAEFQVLWVEMVFNTSGPVEGAPDPELEKRDAREDGCRVVCKVDGVGETGVPEVVSQAVGAPAAAYRLWVVAFVVVSFCMGLL